MSQERQDNCLLSSSQPAIRLPDDLLELDESSQSSGRSLSVSINATTVDDPVQAPRRAMHYFVPRPFPPPALANVPVEYIIDQLHTLAPHYWSKPETADCTIIVPIDGLFRKTGQASRSSGSTPQPFPVPMSSQLGSSTTARRVTEPTLRPSPRMVMKLHVDYLSAHSTLLRGLFSGASPLDLIQSSSHSSQSTPRGSFYNLSLHSNSPPPFPLPSTARGLPIAPLLPRLLPSSPSNPTIYLPVPDPDSFRLLIHYVYFGSTTYIEEALDTGDVTWEGLARNVEFLGMGTEIKVCLGRWYGRWRRGRAAEHAAFQTEEYDEYDDDSYSDSDEDSFFDSDDDEADGSSCTSAAMDESDDDMEIDECLKRTKLDSYSRGRQRTIRRLGHAISDPGPIRGRHSRPTCYISQSSSPSSRGIVD